MRGSCNMSVQQFKYYTEADILENDLLHDIFRGASIADLAEVKSALEEDPRYLNAAHPNGGMSPLAIAAHNGNWGIVEFLLAQPGINVWQQCSLGYTALDYALVSGHETIARVFQNVMYTEFEDDMEWPLENDDGNDPAPTNILKLNPK